MVAAKNNMEEMLGDVKLRAETILMNLRGISESLVKKYIMFTKGA